MLDRSYEKPRPVTEDMLASLQTALEDMDNVDIQIRFPSLPEPAGKEAADMIPLVYSACYELIQEVRRLQKLNAWRISQSN